MRRHPKNREVNGRPSMTVREVAAYLRVSQNTVYRMVEAAKLPGYRLGRSWRFHRRELEEWIRRSRKSRESGG